MHGVLPVALPKQPRQGRTHKEKVPLVEEVRAVLVQEAHVAQLPVLRVRIARAPLQLGQRGIIGTLGSAASPTMKRCG